MGDMQTERLDDRGTILEVPGQIFIGILREQSSILLELFNITQRLLNLRFCYIGLIGIFFQNGGRDLLRCMPLLASRTILYPLFLY